MGEDYLGHGQRWEDVTEEESTELKRVVRQLLLQASLRNVPYTDEDLDKAIAGGVRLILHALGMN